MLGRPPIRTHGEKQRAILRHGPAFHCYSLSFVFSLDALLLFGFAENDLSFCWKIVMLPFDSKR